MGFSEKVKDMRFWQIHPGILTKALSGLFIFSVLIWPAGCNSKKDKVEPEKPGVVESHATPWQAPNDHAGVQGQAVAAVLMVVDEEVITTADALSDLAEPLEQMGQTYDGQQFRTQAERLIYQYLRQRSAEVLLLNEAKASLDEQTATFIDAQVQAYRDQMLRENNNSMTLLRKKLNEQGTTLEQELEKKKREMEVRRYLATRFTRGIVVSRQDILDYYNQHLDDYNRIKKVQLLKILVVTSVQAQDSETPEETRQRAREIAAQAWDALQMGVPFDVVAGEYSDIQATEGGNWGMVDPDSLMEPAERQAAKTLPAGGHSEVLEVGPGYSIIGVGKIEPALQTPLEEVQEEISQLLWERKYSQIYDERVNQLSRRAIVSASPPAVELTVALAQQKYGSGI